MPDTGLDRLLDEFKRLGERFDELEERISRLEGTDAEASPAQFEHAQTTHLIDTEKPPEIDPEEAFGPKTQRRSGASHANAVGKAISMLGLVPDQEDAEEKKQLSSKHKETLGKALHLLGIAPKQKAADTAGGEEPAEKVVLTPAPAEETVAADDAVPLPDFSTGLEEPEEEPEAVEHEPVDLGAALAVDLKRGRADSALPILNAAILLAAVGAALSASGVVSLPGQGAAISWPELGTAGVAALFGSLALTWRTASIHLRGVLGGVATMSLNALVLLALRDRMALPLPAIGGILLATAAVGTRLVLATKHPLALVLGLSASILLPVWLASPPELTLAFVVAVNAAVAVASLRLRRLQAGVAAALFTVVVFGVTSHPHAAAYAGLCALALLVPAFWAPFLYRHAGRSAAVLTLAAFGFTAWIAHAVYTGPWMARIGVLLLPATVAGLIAGRLPRHEDFLRGSLKAGAVLLMLSALPLGFTGQTLAAVGLFISLLFGVFAYSMFDAYLRAAGALLLVLAVSVLARAGASPPLVLAAGVVATVLYAVRARGANPPALALLLGGVAHACLLWAAALALPGAFVPHAWAVLSIGYVVAGQNRQNTFLRLGAVAAAGAAAVGALLFGAPDPTRIAAVGLLLAPHFWLMRPARSAGLMLLLAELLLVVAAQVAFPGPLGVFVALAAPLVLAAPVWRGATETLRPHARFLTLIILVRCLFPDLVRMHVEPAWLNLRFAALVAATVPAFGIVWLGVAGRTAAAALATVVLGAAVWAETLSLPVAGGVVAATALACTLLHKRGRTLSTGHSG